MRDGWRDTTLSEILTRRSDRLGAAPEPRILTVTEGAGLVDQLAHWGRRVATEDVSAYKVVDPGDVVYNVYLLWNGAIGQNLFRERGVTSPVYEVFTPNKSLNPRYIGLLLQQKSMREAFDSISIGTIPRRRRAPWQDFLRLRVALPPRQDQDRIVDLVEALDGAISTSDRATQTARSLARRVRDHLFSEATVGSEGVSAGQYFDMLLGRQKSARQSVGDHVIPYLRAANVSSDGFLLADVQTMNFSPAEQARYCDVMLVEGGSLGQSSMWNGQIPGAIGFDKHVIRLRGVPGRSLAEYALQWTRWSHETGALDAQATGVTIRALGFGRACAMPVPALSLPEQAALVDPLQSADSVVERHRSVSARLHVLRSNLLTALLSGDHEIPESYDELIGGRFDVGDG